MVINPSIHGGYFLGGTSNSNNEDVSGNHGNGDFWMLEIDSLGSIIWQKCYGGIGIEGGYNLVKTSHNGILAAAFSNYSDGDVTGFHGGSSDFWILKTDENTATIPHVTQPQISIYPNPAQDVVSISGFLGLHNIELLDITGRLVYEIKSPQTTVNINLRSFSKGMYIIKSDGFLSKMLLKM